MIQPSTRVRLAHHALLATPPFQKVPLLLPTVLVSAALRVFSAWLWINRAVGHLFVWSV
jgi:hypothetical protein